MILLSFLFNPVQIIQAFFNKTLLSFFFNPGEKAEDGFADKDIRSVCYF